MRLFLFLLIIFLIFTNVIVLSSSFLSRSSSSSSSKTPKSSSKSSSFSTNEHILPHPSFLSKTLHVIPSVDQNENGSKRKKERAQEFYIREIPGDGGCLFHTLSVCIIKAAISKHVDFDSKARKLSDRLREIAIEVLSRKNEILYLEASITTTTDEILEKTRYHYGLQSIQQYLDVMKLPQTWGGGPEIIAISNYLRRPIHIYQLVTDSKFPFFWKRSFALSLLSSFGSPKFDNREPICILYADGRYPNIWPGFQKQPGDHFFPIFPSQDESMIMTTTRGRGSSHSHSHSSECKRGEVDDQGLEDEDEYLFRSTRYKIPTKLSIDEIIKLACKPVESS